MLKFRSLQLILLLGFLAPGVSSGAAAQAPSPSPLGQVDSGRFVRARLDSSRVVRGRYLPLGDGRLGIQSDQGSTDTLRLGDIREFSVRSRHTKTGAIVGGAAGVAFGAFVGFMVSALCETDSCRGAGPFFVAIPAFGAGGALLGAAIGTAFPKWKRIFP